jgi:hypothetical protein
MTNAIDVSGAPLETVRVAHEPVNVVDRAPRRCEGEHHEPAIPL